MLIQIKDSVFRSDLIAAMWLCEDEPYVSVQLSCTEAEYNTGPFDTKEDAEKALVSAVTQWQRSLA